jgi:hypothetical protein
MIQILPCQAQKMLGKLADKLVAHKYANKKKLIIYFFKNQNVESK